MASTNIRGAQVLDGTIARADLNTSTVGQAVVTKIVQGSNISLSSTGADSGTGDVTVAAITQGPSADAGNLITTGSDSLHYLGASQIQPTIWSSRLRSFNAVGNPSFEVDQRNVGNSVTLAAGTVSNWIDRWIVNKTAATAATTFQQMAGPVSVPGTNFAISSKFLRTTLTTQQASLAAGDFYFIGQTIEGSALRELISDVHSVSLLVRSSVAGLTFGLSLIDATPGYSLAKLCTIPSANTWTLITLPNLPIWAAGGTFNITPGAIGYLLRIVLAAGTNWIPAANDTWQSAYKMGAVGQASFLASPTSSTFDVAFCQHESGSQCTQLIDKPFTGANGNYEDCLRYFQKTWAYGTAVGTATNVGMRAFHAWGAVGSAVGPASFHKPTAKVPTITPYNHSTGAASSVRDNGNVDHASATALGPGDSGFYGVTFSVATTAAMPVFCQYTADTGW